MLNYVNGNILDSDAQCIINTVNCEGFQGKGIAYQFKLKYPENEKAYVLACKNNEVKIGKIFFYEDGDKVIANFPTKNEWRKKSEYDYIEKGMIDLVEQIKARKIKSIAIPPLGCGNGGLLWHNVKIIIEQYIKTIQNSIDVYVYSPSDNINKKIKSLPKMTICHLLLLKIKNGMKNFNKFNFQNAVYYFDILSKENIYKFVFINNKLTSTLLDEYSKNIKDYQDCYSITSKEAENKLFLTIISKNIEKKISKYENNINLALKIVNNYNDDINLITLSFFEISNFTEINEEQIIDIFKKINEKKIDQKKINKLKKLLEETGVLTHNLIGYTVNIHKSKINES